MQLDILTKKVQKLKILLMEEKTLKSEFIYKGKILNLKVIEVLLPSGKTHLREIVEHRESVAILPILENKILLIKQFRKAIEKEIWEAPAGRVERGEDILECAIRELKEETGWKARNWEKVGEYLPSPGYSTEKIHLFFAFLEEKEEPSPEEDEFIEGKFFSPTKIKKMIKENEITDGKTLALLCHFFLGETGK